MTEITATGGGILARRTGGRVTASVTGTPLQARSLGPGPGQQVQQRFGSNAAVGATQSPRGIAAGAAVSVGYVRGDRLRADLGSSPFGFPGSTQVLGGVEVAPLLAENLRLRISGERRGVTDSLLSWAGQTDRFDGRSWGQVVRTGGRAQLKKTVAAMPAMPAATLPEPADRGECRRQLSDTHAARWRPDSGRGPGLFLL